MSGPYAAELGGSIMWGSKILVADDDARIKELVQAYFSREGATVFTAEDGVSAVEIARTHQVDAVILDVMMPEMDGFSVCRELRRSWDVPVLMLTAKDEEIDRVLGLELGADDYVVKPFSLRELVARVKAILRRTQGSRQPEGASPALLAYPDLRVDLQARAVLVPGGPAALTPKEFDLLVFLMQNARIVLEREQILRRVWGYDFAGDTRTVDVHVKKLRLKLGELARGYIQTVWGIGYKFEVNQRDG